MTALKIAGRFLKYLPIAIGMALVAMTYRARGQRDRARAKAQQAKAKLQVHKEVQQDERDIATKRQTSHRESQQERQRQDNYRDRGERPDNFGDDRLR